MTRRAVQRFVHAFQDACPVILFFLTSFLIVYRLFGLSYSILVSVLTVFFKTRYKKRDNTLASYGRLLVIGSCLIVLAYVSSLSLALRILFNLSVPFILVFTQSSQFNPKGYYSYAMLFVFLELIPPESIEELRMEIAIFCLGVAYLILAIRIYSHFFLKPADPTMTLKKGFLELSQLLALLPRKERQEELEQKFAGLLHDFHSLSYHRTFFYRRSKENRLYDMFSSLIQRFSYLIADDDWREELDEPQIRLLEQMSDFL